MKERERLHTNFLCDFLNSKYKRKFIVVDGEPESSEVDSIILDIDKDLKINLQCVAFRGEGLIYKRPSSVTISENFPVQDISKLMMVLVPEQYDKRQSIINYIKKKETKYPISLVENLVLLIEATVPSVTPEELVKLFPNGLNTEFKGLYFVQLPVVLANDDYKYDKSGFIYELKLFI